MKSQAMADTETARVFFALWPDAQAQQDLAKASREMHGRYGGRCSRPDSIHLTLVFIGPLETRRIPELLGMAERIRLPRFETEFDRVECWRHNRIGCLGASTMPQGLLGLVQALEAGLKALDISFDRRAYRPHITLLRKADCQGTTQADDVEKKNPAIRPYHWPARDFVLVKSSLRPDGARYEALGRWPLL